jgi:hypothetical protein
MNISADLLTSSIGGYSHDPGKGSQVIYIGFGIGLIGALLCASIVAYSKRIQSVNKCETMYCQDDDTIIQVL